MGELHHDFWWRSLSDRQKQVRTEEEAKLTNEKFGSHKNLSEEMKARIAAKVNEDKISYGEWKALTKPVSDETYASSVLDASEVESTEPPTDEIQGPTSSVGSAVDLITETLTGLDMTRSATIEKQKKHQRRKGKQRGVKNAERSNNFGMKITEPNSPSKFTLMKPAAYNPDEKTTVDNRGENAVIRERINVKRKETEEAVLINLSQDKQCSSSISVVDEDEGTGEISTCNPAYEETHTTSTVIHMDASPTELNSGIIHGTKNRNRKDSTGSSNDVKICRKMDALSEIPAHNGQLSDAGADKAKGNMIVESLQIQQKIQIVDLTSNDTFQSVESSGSTLDKENDRSTEATAKNQRPHEIASDEQIDILSDALSPGAKKLNDALVNGNGTLSTSPVPRNLQRPRPFIVEEQGVISHNGPAQDTGNVKTPINARPDGEITRGINAVIESLNSTKYVSQPQSYNSEGSISVTNLTATNDAGDGFTKRVAIPKKEHLDILHNKVKVNGKEKAPSDGSSDKRKDHNVDSTSAKSTTFSEMTLYEENKGKASIQDLSNKMVHPGAKTATGNCNQMSYPSASLSKKLKDMIVGTNQTNKPDLDVNGATKIIAQRKQTSESVIDQGEQNEPTKNALNITPDQYNGATNGSKTKAVHFNETLSMSREGAGSIEHLADKTMAASSNAANDDATEKGLDREASADNSPENAQGSNSAIEKNGQKVTSPPALKIRDQPTPVPVRPPQKRTRGATGLKWAYFTHTIADEALLANGFWLFEKPKTYFEYQPYHYVRRGMGLIQAPIAVATYEEDDVHEPHEPSIDIDNTGVWINTHGEPWRDVRSKPTHPDFQTTSKLVEYQACESLGIAVWRHDRNLLNCRLPECKAKIADHNLSTKICLGCGPKTIIRYCSEAHQIADLRGHWKECGQPDFLMKRVIDATTSPARFGRLWPAIRDRSGNASYERSRQATYAAMQHGRYTLFDPESEAPTTLIWPTQDPQAVTMEDRVERLLNYALFDHKHGRIAGLLYRMVRHCLILKNFWSLGPIHAVKTQFAAEFGCDVLNFADQPLCECDWVGARLPRDRHVAGCKRLYLTYSAEFQATGIQGFLEMMEGRFWVLRAWRQRHPTVDDWEARVSGRGFAGEVDGATPFFGPGWSGWGSPADDLVD